MISARTLVVGGWIAATGAAAWLAASLLTIENPRGLWTVSPDPPEHQLWAFAQDQFGERDVLLIGLKVPEEAEPHLEASALRLQQWIAAQPEVTQALGIRQLEALRRRVGPLGGSLLAGLRGAVIGGEGSAALTYVVLAPPATPGSLEVKASFLTRLHSESSGLLPTGARLYVAGQPAIDVALDGLLRGDFQQTVPLALAVVGAILLLLIGRMSVTAVVTVAVALVLVLGGLGALDVSVSSATAVALPLTVIVGISYAGHMVLAIDRTGDRRQGTSEIRAPLRWSYLTTLVALGSFVLSPIRALRLFALASCAGLTLAFTGALTLAPHISPRVRRTRSRRARHRLTRLGVRVFGASVRHPAATLVMWSTVGILIVGGALRVRVEPNSYLSFFRDDHPIAVGHRALDDAFGGSVQLQVLARVDSGVAYRQDRVRSRLSSYLEHARAVTPLGPSMIPPPVEAVRGDPDLEASVARWFEGRDGRYTRAIFAVPVMTTGEARRAIDDLESLAQAHSDPEVTLTLTGLLPASLPMQHVLIELLIQSLGLLAVFVLLALVLAGRSVGGGIALLLPNTIAVLAVVAAMGYEGVPIDFTTVCVTSLVLGVAVDDTLQLAWAGRGTHGKAYHPGQAVRRTGAPVLLGTLAMMGGALALTASPFPPTQRLGGLFAVGLATALLADLTLTPIMIGRWLDRRSVAEGAC